MARTLYVCTITIAAKSSDFVFHRSQVANTPEEALAGAWLLQSHIVKKLMFQELAYSKSALPLHHDLIYAAIYDVQDAQKALDILSTCQNVLTVSILYAAIER